VLTLVVPTIAATLATVRLRRPIVAVRRAGLSAALVAALGGCNEVKTALHLMANQDEQECLNSERFNFKDPDVLFVANLGDRGLRLPDGRYWVRYKAKNSYGAYLQGNMICHKNPETKKWERDRRSEVLPSMKIYNFLLDERIKRNLNCAKTGVGCEASVIREKDLESDHDNILFVSAGSLAEYK
jgi:hypothetical protein